MEPIQFSLFTVLRLKGRLTVWASPHHMPGPIHNLHLGTDPITTFVPTLEPDQPSPCVTPCVVLSRQIRICWVFLGRGRMGDVQLRKHRPTAAGYVVFLRMLRSPTVNGFPPHFAGSQGYAGTLLDITARGYVVFLHIAPTVYILSNRSRPCTDLASVRAGCTEPHGPWPLLLLGLLTTAIQLLGPPTTQHYGPWPPMPLRYTLPPCDPGYVTSERDGRASSSSEMPPGRPGLLPHFDYSPPQRVWGSAARKSSSSSST